MTRSGHRREVGRLAAPAGFRHVPALDGVRALAVLAVLAYHGGVPGAHGGFLGVEVFFVLSGYLITGLLVAERDTTGRIALAAFWRRRAVRLLPALLLVVAAVAVGARALMPTEDPERLRGDGLAAMLYVANWRMVFRGDDYFSQTATPSPLEHTWSLGIEEQFYLVWPVLLVAVLAWSRSVSRRTALRRVLIVCVAGVVASSVQLAAQYRATDPGRSYYGTDTRAASLLVGAGLAVILAGRSARARPALGILAGAAALGVGYVVARADGGDGWLYRGGLLLVALGVALVLAHLVLVPDGWPARALSLTPLVLLGRISYGVYLWHWPVFVVANAARTGRTGLDLFAVRSLVTLALATASYLLVEQPVRRLGTRARTKAATSTALAGVTAALVVASLAPTTADATVSGGAEPVFPRGAQDGMAALGPAPVDVARSDAAPRHRAKARHRHPVDGRTPVVDVFGDSVGWSLVSALPDQPGLDIRDRTILGCGVARIGPYRYFGQLYPGVAPECRHWPDLWRHAIDVDDPDGVLIVVGRWETMDRELHDRWTHVGQPALDAYLRSELSLAIRTAGARGARVMFTTEPYNRRGEQLDGSLWPEDEPERVTAWNALLRDVVADHHRVRLVDLGHRLTPDGQFTWTAGGYQVRYDGVHLTPSGVQGWIAPWLVPQLRAAVR
jgi:peptidoglycan/LPS O-acetylase OafA/YrhL